MRYADQKFAWRKTANLLESSVCGKANLPGSRRVSGRWGHTNDLDPGLRSLTDIETGACKTLFSCCEGLRFRKACWVSFMVKLLRAYGGCLGANRR